MSEMIVDFIGCGNMGGAMIGGIVSIAAGQTLDSLKLMFGQPVKLIRAMPNTPALVGESMSALCCNSLTTADDPEKVCAVFNSFGKCEVISENLMDAVVGVSGSPGALKDAVCSPGGTTIEAVAVLEANGLRNTVISAQRACSAKSRDMAK